MKRFFSHRPALVDAVASGIWRASANIIAMACSAVVIELPCGVFITITPRAVADFRSTLSTPMPARPITFRLVATSSNSRVTLVADRIASPSYPPMIARSSAGVRPGLTSTSTPRLRKMSTASVESLSLMRTFTIGATPRPCWRVRRRPARRPNRATAAAWRCRSPPPSHRPRCANPAVHRDRRRRRSATPSFSSNDASFFAAAACASALNDANQGATIFRQIDVLERVAASWARKAAQSLSATHLSSTARLARLRAISAGRPPICSAQRSPSSASSTQSIDGVLIVSPAKMPSISLPPFVRRKIFGNGQAGL